MYGLLCCDIENIIILKMEMQIPPNLWNLSTFLNGLVLRKTLMQRYWNCVLLRTTEIIQKLRESHLFRLRG
jgi:hypothetical protein